jgi:cystathionine beta-lyase
MDNTWGIHFFQPLRHGVDVSIQALTKYVSGHSDLVLGAITTGTEADYIKIRSATRELGECASPDDCWLALRGVRTFVLRLTHQMQAGLQVAAWLAARPEVAQVLHPGLPGAPGHELWARDFAGACSLFGVVLQSCYAKQSMFEMIDRLTLFGIGASWGGFESLVLPTTGAIARTSAYPGKGHAAFRLHIGLEDTKDLIADLAAGLAGLRAE